MKLLVKICNVMEKVVIYMSAFLLLVLVVLVCVNVFARYVLNSSVSWIAEVSITLMMWVGLLGAAGCICTNAHMRLHLVLDRFPDNIRRWLLVFIDVLLGAFSVFIFIEGIELVSQTMGGTMSTLPISLGVTYLVLPVASGLMTFFSAMNIIRQVVDNLTRKESDIHG